MFGYITADPGSLTQAEIDRYGFQTGGTFCNPICLSWCLLNACCGGNGLYFCC